MIRVGRIQETFAMLAQKGEKALIPFIMGGDPNLEWSQDLLMKLPAMGADIIEIGMPFSDPMADGPVIQRAGLRALAANTTLAHVLVMVKKFRENNKNTPIILMGYYNPIHNYGEDKFLIDAIAVGVDALIIVDTPPEEDRVLCIPAQKKGLDFIRLVTPTTDAERASRILASASGFVYGVSIAGITGTKQAGNNAMANLAGVIKAASNLPAAVGFGIKTVDDVRNAAKYFDAVVVGSAIIEQIEKSVLDVAMLEDTKIKILELVKQMKLEL